MYNRRFWSLLGTMYLPCIKMKGVPQRTALSVTFLPLPSMTLWVECVDNCTNYCWSQSLPATEQLQPSIKWSSVWSKENGFKISISWTLCVYFCHLREIFPDPILFMDTIPLPCTESVWFLGLLFRLLPDVITNLWQHWAEWSWSSKCFCVLTVASLWSREYNSGPT